MVTLLWIIIILLVFGAIGIIFFRVAVFLIWVALILAAIMLALWIIRRFLRLF